MNDLPKSAPTSALPQRRTTPTLADLSPHYPEPKELQDLLPKETYIVEGFLGQGGMGAVYHGIQISLNRPVAIKVMELGIGQQYDYADRFRREAQAMATMSHPNIVNVFDFGTAAGKYLYIVMELIDGSDLHHVIKAGQMTPELALHLVPQICDALAYAHEHGIVHRDIKPANIMLTKDWRVKVADFGLAKRFDANSTLMTRSNLSMGTPDYAAPEQFSEPATVDHRADIYALGVTFYQMLTGSLPRGAWSPPSQVVKTDPRLDPIVVKAMFPRREDRYQSARELQQSVIGFTQMKAWEYQNQGAMQAVAAQAAVQTAQPQVPTAQVPKPQKPVAKLAPPPGSRAPKGVDQGADGHGLATAATKSRLPLYLGLGAAAVIAIGAFFLNSRARKGVDETPQAAASTADHALAGAATSSGPSEGRAAGPPAAASVPTASNPPKTPSTALGGPSDLPPDLQAKLDAVPWTKLDLSAPPRPAYSQSNGSAEYKNGRLELRGGYFYLIGRDVRDAAVRVKLAPGTDGVTLNLRTRTDNTPRIVVGRNKGKPKAMLATFSPKTRQLTDLAPPFDMHETERGCVLEVVLIGEALHAFVDGQPAASARVPDLMQPGNLQIFGQQALIESIEYKILDGVAAPAAAKTPQWTKVDLSGPLERTHRTETGLAVWKDGALDIQSGHIGIVPQARDVVVRWTMQANPEESSVWIDLRDQPNKKRISIGRESQTSEGRLKTYDPATKESRDLSPPFSLPVVGTSYTMEAFAVGDAFGVRVDGQQAAFGTVPDVSAPGRVTLFAYRGRVASVEYLVLDDLPREQWPDFVREAIETKGKPAPLAQSQTSNPPSDISLDAPGWTRLDLAKAQEEPGKVERLPDGAIKLTKGYIFTDSGFSGDAAIRVRWRGQGTEGNGNERIIIRDDQQVGYSANVPRNGNCPLFVFPHGNKNVEARNLTHFPRPPAGQTFTLELRAQGSTLTVLLDGKQVAQAQDDQLKFGRLGVFADRGIVEGIAYQVGDAAAPADDDAGWQKMDFAKVQLEPGRRDRLADGTLKLSRNFVWSDQSYEDVQVRVRFRAGSGVDNPRILVREDQGVAYSLSGDTLYKQVYGHDALQKGIPSAELAKLSSKTSDIQTMELHIQGGQLTGFINGQKVGDARDESLKFGRVGFYANEGIIESFEIKPLLKDRATLQPGALVWKTALGASIVGPASHGADGKVYVGVESSEEGLAALHPKDGSILWKTKLAGKPREGMAPVVADDGSVLIVVHGETPDTSGRGVLHCVDGGSGKEKWRFAFDEGGTSAHFAGSSVAVSADGKVYLSHKAAFCLDLATGRQLWSTPYGSEVGKCAPVIAANGTVVFPAGLNAVALHPHTGGVLWQARLAGTCWADPAVDGNNLFITGESNPKGNLRCYDITTGQMRWETVLDSKLDASLALDTAGRVFATSLEHHVSACDAVTGAKLWEYPQGSTSRPRGFTVGADGLVYTTFDKHIVCLKPDSQEIVWRVPTTDGIWAVPLLLDDGLLITGSRDKNVYAIQTSSKGLADSPWPTMGQNNRRNGRAKGAQVIVLQDTPTDKKLREIEAKARAEYEAGPGKVFADAAATLRSFYANALRKNAAQSQKEGHLDHMLAFQQEADAFAAGTITAPPADAPGTPEPLKVLRETFRKTMATHEATRDRAAAPIYAKWDTALAALQAELTKEGEINEALRVKKLRDQITATKALTVGRDSGPASGASRTSPLSNPTPAGPQSRPTSPATPAPKLAKADDRQIAEWVLSLPGSKVQHYNNSGTWSSEITSADKLPRGEFAIAKVQIADASKVTEAQLLQVIGLERLSSLYVLSNGYNAITPAVIAALVNRKESLTRLRLCGTNLEDADFAPLAACGKLFEFDVTNSPRFTGKALAYVAQAPIEQIQLSSCPITEEAFATVAQMKSLREVELDGLKLSAALFAALPANLDELKLGSMGHLKGNLAPVARFKGLTTLALGYWPGVTVDDAKAIASLPSLRVLNAPSSGGDAIRAFATMKKLEELTLSTIPQDGNAALSALAACKQLRFLHLAGGGDGNLDDSGLAGVAAIQQLERLDLGGMKKITAAGLAHVAKLPKLTWLKLSNTSLTDPGLAHLHALKKLEELDLTGCQVSAGAVAAFKAAVPKCKVVGP